MLWEGKATFEYFSVELTPNHLELESIPGLSNFEVEVCVLKPVGSDGTSRVSVEPWWLESEKGEIQRPIEARYEPAFPAKDALEAGECTKGWLAFNNFGDTSVDYTYLIYQNGLGERAVWSFH